MRLLPLASLRCDREQWYFQFFANIEILYQKAFSRKRLQEDINDRKHLPKTYINKLLPEKVFLKKFSLKLLTENIY
jgi:hypothetical protein